MISTFKRNKKLKDVSIYKRMIVLSVYYKSEETKEFKTFVSDLIIRLPELDYNITVVHNEVEEDYDDFCQNMNLNNVDSGLIISDSNSPESVFYVKHKPNIISMTFWFEYESERLKKITDAVIKTPYLYYASLYSQYDNKWENEEQILVYEINKRSQRGKQYAKDVFDKKCIDISYNYGRTLKINNIGFVAGWKMWFGSGFPSNIKSKLDSLAVVNKAITDDEVEIQLFDKLTSEDYEKNRPIQKQFLELIETTYNTM